MELDGVSEGSEHTYRMLVTRTETRARKVTLDDAFRFAAALGVPPTALLYPTDGLERVEIAPQIHLAAFLFEAWVQGPLPLSSEDAEMHGANRTRGIGLGRLAMWVLGYGEFQWRTPGTGERVRPQLNDAEREALRAWVGASRKKNEENMQDLDERGEVEGAQETREYLRGVEQEFSEIEQALDEKEEQ
jgi:hypothetical protein